MVHKLAFPLGAVVLEKVKYLDDETSFFSLEDSVGLAVLLRDSRSGMRRPSELSHQRNQVSQVLRQCLPVGQKLTHHDPFILQPSVLNFK